MKYIIILILITGNIYAQTGVNLTNPQHVLHIDGGETVNAPFDQMVVTSEGRLGIGTNTPRTSLDVVSTYPTGTGNPTTIDGLTLPSLSKDDLNQITSPINIGTMVHVNDIAGAYTSETIKVVKKGNYFWDGQTWAYLMVFDEEGGAEISNNTYNATNGDINKSAKCGKFEFALDNNTPKIKLTSQPSNNITVRVLKVHAWATDNTDFRERNVTFSTTNWNDFKATYFIDSYDSFRNGNDMIKFYLYYPGEKDLYLLKAFRMNDVYSVICHRY